MTFAEMQLETFRRLREASGDGVYFTTADIAAALNAGYMELSDATEWFEEYLEIDLLTARPYYDLFTLIGCAFLSLRPTFDEQTNRWLLPSTVRGLDDHDRRWERVVGEPQRIFMRGLRWLGLYPRINADAGRVKVYYTRLPDPLCADDDEPGFPEAYHPGCIAFALADLWAQDAESALAVTAWTDYLRIEQGLGQWVNERTSRPMHRILGAVSGPGPR